MFRKLFKILFNRKEDIKEKASPPKEEWEIKIVCTRDKQTYFESDMKYEYRIVNNFTNKIVKTYYRDEYDNSEGSSETGVKEVFFSEDKRTVLATFEDGREEVFDLYS